MSDDPFAHGFQKWESRFQQSSADQWALRPDISREVVIAVDSYQQRYGEAHPRVIDLGAGDGRHTLYLADRGLDVLAVEAAPAGAELIRQKLSNAHLSAEVVVADLRDYTIPDDLDILISSYVIHLLPDPYEQIKLWQSKVRPGGVCSLATRATFGEQDPPHYWFPEDFELKRLFVDAGWEIIHAREEDNWNPYMSLLFRQRAVVAFKPK